MAKQSTDHSKFYRRFFIIVAPIFYAFFRIKIIGQENIPEGAAVVCVNHSSMLDPLFIGIAVGKRFQSHFIAKAELFKTPIISWFVKGLGAISVDRSKADIGTIKESLNYLKNGKKIVIFPEGTRAAEDNAQEAKHGAIKIAERANAPIIPIYLPRKKPLFAKVTIVIGKPYVIERQKTKRTHEDYDRLSDEMMDKIIQLKECST